MATTTPDDEELEGRMHVGDAARAVVAKLDGGVRRGLTGSVRGDLRRIVLLMLAAAFICWPNYVVMVPMLVLLVLAFDAGRQR